MQLTRKTFFGWCPFLAAIQTGRNINSFKSNKIGKYKASTNRYTKQKPFISYLVNPFIFTTLGIKGFMLETSQLQCESRTTLLHV
jgi:hypothetical protein